jgi:hypothetical protein
VMNLQKFVEDGGLFVPITNCVRIPIEYGITNGVTIREPQQLQARGSIYNARFTDRGSPISYGYAESLPIYFNQAPLFQVTTQGGGGAGGGEQGGGSAGRPSGRGSVNDPDIVQGMPLAEPAPQRRPGADQLTDEQRLQQGAFFTPAAMRPRIVLRFGPDEKTLLISGMLSGGSELVNAPAIVDVPVGQGHVVMFATNPMWRHQTQGSFFLLFNAILNYDHLDVGREASANPSAGVRTEDQ